MPNLGNTTNRSGKNPVALRRLSRTTDPAKPLTIPKTSNGHSDFSSMGVGLAQSARIAVSDSSAQASRGASAATVARDGWTGVGGDGLEQSRTHLAAYLPGL